MFFLQIWIFLLIILIIRIIIVLNPDFMDY